MPTSGESPSREKDGQLGLLVGYRFGRKLKDGPPEPSVLAFHDVQRQSCEPKAAPLSHELC